MKLAFSAPGKAFLAGGYLVLDPENSAYVVALSARMHALIEGEKSTDGDVKVRVLSPQFKEGEWSFEKGEMKLGKNPFVEAVIRSVLAYLDVTTGHDITITIYSDSAYHSQSEMAQTSRFIYHDQPISQVPKTGLGSSAALTVVLTTALLSYFSGSDQSGNLTLIHNLSQLAHCSAQGKIGSGFDVGSATYGSIVYRRFSPTLLTEAMNDINNRSVVKSVIDQPWNVTTKPISLPPGISLLMGDVKGGSETPKMVSTVLKWKADNPNDSNELWARLDLSNMELVELLSALNKLSESNEEEYKKVLSNPQGGLLEQMGLFIKQIRANLREMSEKTGVPIEPPEQTELLDACTLLPGVIGGVVPGAGGHDAICLVVLTDSVSKIIESTKTNPQFEKLSWLDLHEQSVGVKVEDVSSYPN